MMKLQKWWVKLIVQLRQVWHAGERKQNYLQINVAKTKDGSWDTCDSCLYPAAHWCAVQIGHWMHHWAKQEQLYNSIPTRYTPHYDMFSLLQHNMVIFLYFFSNTPLHATNCPSGTNKGFWIWMNSFRDEVYELLIYRLSKANAKQSRSNSNKCSI